MGNARKSYVNIEKLSSGDIYLLLDLFESDDEGEIENLMNKADTEFVAEKKTVISISDSMKEGNVDQSSSISVPEASIHV